MRLPQNTWNPECRHVEIRVIVSREIFLLATSITKTLCRNMVSSFFSSKRSSLWSAPGDILYEATLPITHPPPVTFYYEENDRSSYHHIIILLIMLNSYKILKKSLDFLKRGGVSVNQPKMGRRRQRRQSVGRDRFNHATLMAPQHKGGLYEQKR